MGGMFRWLRLAPAVVLSGALGCVTPASQLVVVVDTDMAIPAEMDEVRLDVARPDGTTATLIEEVSGRMVLPLSAAVIADGDQLGPIDVTASAYLDGDLVLARGATVTLVRHETRVLSLFLLSNCRGVTCAPGTTCGEGGTCRDVEIEELPPYTGTLPSLDTGVPDGGLRDGAVLPDVVAPDVPPMPCDSDAECDDGLECTTDRCGTTGCEHVGQSASCDDDDACTDDVCVVGVGCVASPNTAPCDDGLYCNGSDTCAAGACTSHAGDPCASPTTCAEADDECVGCVSDTDCPDVVGTFGSCDWGGDCDESASRSRTDIQRSCVAGRCQDTPVVVTEPCARETDDMGCGMGSCGGYGACGGFSDTCDESGTQSRSCTDLVCVAGTCTGRMRMESQSCPRTTGGTACGSAMCGAWGTCNYASGCANAGTQSRTCMDGTCGGGTCNYAGSRMESQACGARDTTGMDCGSSCGSYGACGGWSSDCDESGTMSRACTPRTCSGGACVTGADMIQSTGCARETDGAFCNPDTCSIGGGTCVSGSCDGPSECVSGCVCDNAMPFGNCYDPTPPIMMFCPRA